VGLQVAAMGERQQNNQGFGLLLWFLQSLLCSSRGQALSHPNTCVALA